MLQLIYVSSAKTPFSKPDLQALLAQSRAKNHACEVTGILLYKGGNFMQVLEGKASTVLELYGRIARDPRHIGVQMLLRSEITERQFPDWSMAYRDLGDPALGELAGFNDFLNIPLDASIGPTPCLKLLAVFRTRM